jgi:uncharacterized protein (DUF433 family)
MTSLVGITCKDPEVMSGALVFSGTRIPVRSLFDYLEGGEPIAEFLRQFPSVSKAQAIAVLDAAFDQVVAN